MFILSFGKHEPFFFEHCLPFSTRVCRQDIRMLSDNLKTDDISLATSKNISCFSIRVSNHKKLYVRSFCHMAFHLRHVSNVSHENYASIKLS